MMEHHRPQVDVEAFLVSRVMGSETVEMNSADWSQMREEFTRRRATGGDR